MGRRAALSVAAGGLALLAVAGCGGKASPAQQQAASVAEARASATAVGKAVAAPTDCRSASGVGAFDAEYAVTLIANIDYRNARQVSAVVQPLLTPSFFTTYTTELGKVLPTVVSQQETITVTITSLTYASGTCDAPVYAVGYTERTRNPANGVQPGSNKTAQAAMTWNGATYLLNGF